MAALGAAGMVDIENLAKWIGMYWHHTAVSKQLLVNTFKLL